MIKIFAITFITLCAVTPDTALAGPIAALLGGGGIGSLLGKFVVNALVSAVVSSVFGRKKGKGFQREEQGVLVNKNSSNDPLPVFYGRVRAGGVRVYMQTNMMNEKRSLIKWVLRVPI